MGHRGLLSLLCLTLFAIAGCPSAPQDVSGLATAVDNLCTTETSETLRDVGDELLARRQRIPELFPELAELINAGAD